MGPGDSSYTAASMIVRDPLAVLAVLVGLVVACHALERRFPWARRIGASLLVIASGALLSNLGLVPQRSAAYEAVAGPVTSLAIVWLLLAVDLRDLARAGGRMLSAFAIATTGTLAGAFVAALLFRSTFAQETWKLAGVLTATYSGGSLNFVAVGREVGLTGALFAATAASDNVLTTLWMGWCLAAPLLFAAGAKAAADEKTPHPLQADLPMRVHDLAVLVLLGLAVVQAGRWLAARFPAVPEVLWLTTLALALAQLPAMRRQRGALPLGVLALDLFLGVIGVHSRFGEIAEVGPRVFYMTATVVAVHGVWSLGWGRLARLELPAILVASQAAIGGPSTALALAVARGWRDLLLPGVLVGLLGYALGNYAGLAVAALVRHWLLD